MGEDGFVGGGELAAQDVVGLVHFAQERGLFLAQVLGVSHAEVNPGVLFVADHVSAG